VHCESRRSPSKPFSDLQKRILVGAAKRLGLSAQAQQEIASARTAVEADALLLKFEAQNVCHAREEKAIGAAGASRALSRDG
jgi:hypothetical protein